jgi:phosphotransferase system enzyme I (PtsI)
VTVACTGIGVVSSASVAIGPAYVISRGPVCVTPSWVTAEAVDTEVERFETAIQVAAAQLRNVREQIPGMRPG